MSKQTSQMYGIKVKETINYAEMGDIALYYEDSLWTVKSNFENVWRDGVHYDKGDTIVTFQDGEVATFTMMGQHTDVSPYINKLYNVYSNASENPQAGDISVEYRVTNSDRPHGGYSEVYEIVIFKLVNGLIQDRKYISSEDVRKYKMTCDKPVPAWNLTVDWNYTNPQSGYPMKSWVIRSNSNYIKYEEQYYKVGEDLDVFECNDPILMEIVDETQKHETKKKVGEPPLVVVTERVDGGKPTSWSYNRENIVHDILHTHKDVYYNGHRHKAMYLLYSKTSVAGSYKTVKGLAFAWADPYWFLVTNAEGMEYNGQILKKGQLIKAWSPGDSLNLYVKKDTAVRKPKTDIPYDNITYELLATGDTNVTVIRLVNDEEPPDSRVVIATSDSPKVCWGIELRVEGSNWTIYSKNNFIKYNGRTYKKNKSILSFGLDEELHIEIKDEENKYYIKSSMTYHVTNEAADSVNYKVRTSKMDRNIIIEKSVNGNEEPWVRVNTYDAIIMPCDYEDLSLEFNIVNRSWVLRALSDNVYSDGVKYDTNETIAEWHYTEIKELNHIEALKDSEENIKVAVDVTGMSTEFGQDFDEFVPDDYQDFEVLHSSTKALWKVLSNNDDTWSSGINYKKGDVILEVADKTFVDPFTVSVRYYNESQHVYSYRTYSISLTYSALTNKTNLIIDPTNGNPIVFNDKTVNEGDVYSITKQNAKSMYGYIWKRDMPGPGPTPLFYDFIIGYCRQYHPSSYVNYTYMDFIGFKNSRMIQLSNRSTDYFEKYFYVQQHDAKQYFIRLVYNYYMSSVFMGIDSEGDIQGISFNRLEIPLKFVNNSDIICIKLNSTYNNDVETIIIYRIFERTKTEISRLNVDMTISDFARGADWYYNPTQYFMDPMDHVLNSSANTISFIRSFRFAGMSESMIDNTFEILDLSNMQFLTSAADWDDIFDEFTDTYDTTTHTEGAKTWVETHWTAETAVDPSDSSVIQFSHRFNSRAGFALKEDGLIYVYFFLRVVTWYLYDYGRVKGYGLNPTNYKVCAMKLDAKSNTRTLLTEIGEESDYYWLLSYPLKRPDECPFIKYNGNFYSPRLEISGNIFKIIKINPNTASVSIEREINLISNPDAHIEVRCYYDREMQSYGILNVYFDDRSWSKANMTVGLFSMHFQRQYLNNRYCYCFHVNQTDDPDFPNNGNYQLYALYLLIDNPLINSSALNMAFLESAITN